MQQIGQETFQQFIDAVKAGRLSHERIKRLREQYLKPCSSAYLRLSIARRKTLDADLEHVDIGPQMQSGELVAMGFLSVLRSDFVDADGLEATALAYRGDLEAAKTRHFFPAHDMMEARSHYIELFEEGNGFELIREAGFEYNPDRAVEAFNRGYVSTFMAQHKTLLAKLHPLIRSVDQASEASIKALEQSVILQQGSQRTVLDISKQATQYHEWIIYFSILEKKEVMPTNYYYEIGGSGSIQHVVRDAQFLARSLAKYFSMDYVPEVFVGGKLYKG